MFTYAGMDICIQGLDWEAFVSYKWSDLVCEGGEGSSIFASQGHSCAFGCKGAACESILCCGVGAHVGIFVYVF